MSNNNSYLVSERDIDVMFRTFLEFVLSTSGAVATRSLPAMLVNGFISDTSCLLVTLASRFREHLRNFGQRHQRKNATTLDAPIIQPTFAPREKSVGKDLPPVGLPEGVAEGLGSEGEDDATVAPKVVWGEDSCLLDTMLLSPL